MGKPVTMTENRLAIRRAFLDGKINAVCGYPGIGKTYLTMIHPTFIDGFFSKQYYTDKKKGIVNPDFPENYARFCAEAMERGQNLRGKTQEVMVRFTPVETIVRL